MMRRGWCTTAVKGGQGEEDEKLIHEISPGVVIFYGIASFAGKLAASTFTFPDTFDYTVAMR